MADVVWSAQALRDIESIRDYIAQDSPAYADLVVRRVVGATERLSAFSELGRIVPERGVPSLREVIIRPYRVVYRLRDDAVQIVTVFHAARTLPSTDEN